MRTLISILTGNGLPTPGARIPLFPVQNCRFRLQKRPFSPQNLPNLPPAAYGYVGSQYRPPFCPNRHIPADINHDKEKGCGVKYDLCQWPSWYRRPMSTQDNWRSAEDVDHFGGERLAGGGGGAFKASRTIGSCWESCWTMLLVGGFSRGSPIYPTTFILALLHTHLTSPSSALKTPILRAAQISSLTYSGSPNVFHERESLVSPETKSNEAKRYLFVWLCSMFALNFCSRCLIKQNLESNARISKTRVMRKLLSRSIRSIVNERPDGLVTVSLMAQKLFVHAIHEPIARTTNSIPEWSGKRRCNGNENYLNFRMMAPWKYGAILQLPCAGSVTPSEIAEKSSYRFARMKRFGYRERIMPTLHEGSFSTVSSKASSLQQ
ncbi:hypothetical protein PR048_011661 [Dryococelus australis]|uniref:Uncharacterized protein n=1 Tax=Dryococelus australis TaxID=614101 RepID=A0ABQ9HM50_9NEOP|nr:hypothetical protein PR048_011661 [Dryococelus australis]